MKILSGFVFLVGVLIFSSTRGQAGLDDYRVECSAKQRVVVDAALHDAKALANKAASALPPKESNTGQKVIRWFGADDSATTNLVANIYSSAGALLVFKKVWCPNASFPGDDEGTLAWVPREAAGEMFVEILFFQATNKGADSKGGTILHEAVHLSIGHKIVDTDSDGDGIADYGISSAESLARGNPAAAVLTADNLQYFAEDVLYGIPK